LPLPDDKEKEISKDPAATTPSIYGEHFHDNRPNTRERKPADQSERAIDRDYIFRDEYQEPGEKNDRRWHIKEAGGEDARY
jgi:hypothetical protein